MNAQIEKLMKNLDLTREEALQVIADDKAIDKGEKLFELTDEQKKNEKKMRQAQRQPTVYNFKQKRTKKKNTAKAEIIAQILNSLTDIENLDIINDEKEFTFEKDSVKYKVVLSCPRKQ